MSVHKNFGPSLVSLSGFKLLNSKIKSKNCAKVDFFSTILNSKLFVRSFSTVINLPKLNEQKEKTLLFFLDNLWDAEELLRSRYCLIMILSFKKYLDNTVHSSPVKSRMDLNLVRKYVKLILLYLKNSLVRDIDRINSKFLIFFYFLTKTAGFLTKFDFFSTRKMVLRNLFFIFIFSKARARYFANLTVTNNVISKSYVSFLPKIKYASAVFPTGLFLVIYSPYKSSFNLGFTSRLILKHKQFLQKLIYIHKLLNVHKLKWSRSVKKMPLFLFGFAKRFSKTGSGSSIFYKNFFGFESKLLRSKIQKNFKFKKIKNLGSFTIFKEKGSSISTHFLSTKFLKKNNSTTVYYFKFRSRTKLFFKRFFSRVFFLSSVSKSVKRLLISLITRLRFLAASISFKLGNKIPRGRLIRLLKSFTRRRIWLRQLYKFFSYSFIRTKKQVFNSMNKIIALFNSFINFKKFGKNVLSFLNFYRPQYYMFKKFKYLFLNKINQCKNFNNFKNNKKNFIRFSISSQNLLTSSKFFILKKRSVERLNSLLQMNSSFFFFSDKNFLNLKKMNVPFISNMLFSNLRILIFSKFFNFKKFSDIFFFYLSLVKLVKTSLKFSELRSLLIYFPLFSHYGSRFVYNNAVVLKLLSQNFVVLLDNIILSYKNLFNSFIKFRLFKIEQSQLDKIGTFSKTLLKKRFSKFKYLRKTPVQTFIVERQNLRNLEFMTGKVKKLVMKFKYFTRRKNDSFFLAKLKRKEIRANKHAKNQLVIKKNRIIKKKNISSKVLNSPLLKYFETEKFKKKYALYNLVKKRFVKRWKRQDALAKRLKQSKMGFFEEDFSSFAYIHRFNFRKRILRVDYRRLKRKFFVNFLFFMRILKRKRIAYNYYKIGRKSFKLAALQKISSPFFLRLKLKRYLISEKYKKMINRFSFLNSSYGLKSCITKFCSFMSFYYVNFFDSHLDKYKVAKFSFFKTYKFFFSPLVSLSNFDLVYIWLARLKNYYFFHEFDILKFMFSVYLIDYLVMLKFLFRKTRCFFFPKKLLVFLFDFKILAIFIHKIKNFACSLFFIFSKAFICQNFTSKTCYKINFFSEKRFYSTYKSLIFRKEGSKCQIRLFKNTFFKFRFYFFPLFKNPSFSLCSFASLYSKMLLPQQSLSTFSSYLNCDFANFSKIYSIPCFNFKKKVFSCLNHCFQFGFLKLTLEFFPNIFLFQTNFENKSLHSFNTIGINSNLFCFGIGFFSFLYSISRISRFAFSFRLTSFFRMLTKSKKRKKIIIKSPYYPMRKRIKNKYEYFLSGLMYRSKRPRIIEKKRKRAFRKWNSTFRFQAVRSLEVNSRWHKLFKMYMLHRVKRRKVVRIHKLLRKSTFFSKKAKFKVYKQQLSYKKPLFVHKFKFEQKIKKFRPRIRYIKFLSHESFLNFVHNPKLSRNYKTAKFKFKLRKRRSPYFTRVKKKKKRVFIPSFRSNSLSLTNQLVKPSILKGTLSNKRVEGLIAGNAKIYPFKKIFFFKKYFSGSVKFNRKFFSNSKIFISKLFNRDLKFFTSFYNFSLSKINFCLINFKTQRFLRLLLLASYQFQDNCKHLFKTQVYGLNKILRLENFSEYLFILDFFELSYLNLEFDLLSYSSDLTILSLIDNFNCIFHMFYFQINSYTNFMFLYYFHNLYLLLNSNHFIFLNNHLEDLINNNNCFFEFILEFTFFSESAKNFLKKKKYFNLFKTKMKSKLKLSMFNSFPQIFALMKVFFYLVNYFKLNKKVLNVIPWKHISHNLNKHSLSLLFRLNFIRLKSVRRPKRLRRKSRNRTKFRRFLVFKNSFFLFLHSLFISFLEKFLSVLEKTPLDSFNKVISFVVGLFFTNLNLFSSGNTVFKLVIAKLFRKVSFRNFNHFNLRFKLGFLKILVSNNQKFVSLLKERFLVSKSLLISTVFPSKHKYKHRLFQSRFKLTNKFVKSELVQPTSLEDSRIFSLVSSGLICKSKLLNFKKLRKWNKHLKRKFFTKSYSGKRSKRFFARRFRRRLKKYFFSEFYSQIFEKSEIHNSQLSHLLLLRKAANLKLFSRYKVMVKTPKKNSFNLLFKNELEPTYKRFSIILSPNRSSIIRRRFIVKKRFHSLLKRKIIVGFFLSPRFLNLKNFSNSNFFMKVNFNFKIKNKLSLFLRLNRFMEFIFKVILRVKLFLKRKAFIPSGCIASSSLIIGRFFSDHFYFYIVKVYRKLKLLTISFFNKLSIYFSKIRGFDDRLTKKYNFRFDNLKFLFFYNFLSSKFLRIFVLRYFFFGYYIKYRFQFINRFLWFRVLPLNSFLLTPKVFVIVTRVKNNFFITGVDLYGRILYKTSPGVVHFTGSDRVSKYAWFDASVDFFDGFIEFFRYFLRSRKRKKISYTLLKFSREVNINFNKRRKKFGAFLHPFHYISAARRKLKKKAKKRRLKSKVILRRFFVISKGVSDFHLRIFVKGMLNERYYVSKYFAGSVNYPMRSFSLCRIKKVRRV